LLIAYDHQQPAGRPGVLQVVAATILVRRIDADVIRLTYSSQHVGPMGLKLGMVTQQLVVPDAHRQDDPRTGCILGFPRKLLGLHGRRIAQR